MRNAALVQLEQYGPEASEALPILIDVLKNDSVIANRAAAIRGLAALKPDAKTAMPALIRVLQSPELPVPDESVTGLHLADEVVSAIGSFGPAAADAVPALTALLKRQLKAKDGHYETTIQALGQIGPAAKEAAPVIREVRRHWPDGIEKTIEIALQNIEK